MGTRSHVTDGNRVTRKTGSIMRARVGVTALLVAGFATACTTTQQVPVQRAGVKCGFLGSDCDRLTPLWQEECGAVAGTP